MKKTIVSNILAAFGILILLLLIDVIHVYIHPIGGKWWMLPLLAITYASFFVANRGILKNKSPFVRFTTIALLSALLAVAWFELSFIIMIFFHGAIGGTS